MEKLDLILEKLALLENQVEKQLILQKEVLTFKEACWLLNYSASHLYKLTHAKLIPYFCPQGKKLYFNRRELEAWMQRGRQEVIDDLAVDDAIAVLAGRR